MKESRGAQPPRDIDQSVPLAAQGQPGRLVAVVRRGVRRGPRTRGPDPAERRLRRLPLVPRHGARVLRGRRGRGYLNEHFVCIKVDREERPDVDAVYMEATQAMTGPGRLADDLRADAGPASRSSAARTSHRSTAPGCRRSVGCSSRSSTPGPRDARRSSSAGADVVRELSERATSPLTGAGITEAALDAAARELAERAQRRDRRLRRRAAVPAVDGLGVPAAPRRADWIGAQPRDRRDHLRADGARRHVRPARRRLCPLLRGRRAGSCRTSRRCCTTTLCWPGCTPTGGG